jgi:hypothetical protein
MIFYNYLGIPKFQRIAVHFEDFSLIESIKKQHDVMEMYTQQTYSGALVGCIFVEFIPHMN